MDKNDLVLVGEGIIVVLLVTILLTMGKPGETADRGVDITPTPTSAPIQATEIPLRVTERPKEATPTPQPSETPTPTPSVAPVAKKEVESGHAFKPYTGYWAYTLKSSQQYKLQQIALTSADTGIRMVQDPNGEWRYCVALGTYWAGGHPQHIGRCVDIFMQNGATLKCVLADVKKQEDTKGKANKYGATNNDVLEFIVDDKKIPAKVKQTGNVSNAGEQFEGGVMYILIYDMWIEGFGGQHEGY